MSGVEQVEIAAGRFHLRPPSAADAADALAMLRDPDTVRWNPVPRVVDVDTARDWCERAADWSDGSHATFAVLDAVTGRFVGNVSLWRIDLADQRTAAVGYRSAPWARGLGVATAAVRAVTGWAFGALGVERVELPHAVANQASCRVAEKAGFRLEGTLRASFRAEDGQRYDEHLHARLATDA
jgi:RimJ/RimL family protein N-acetyltransferase